MKAFGEIIREQRIKRGLVLRQVAAATDIDQATISKYEKCERKPSKMQVLQFAKLYNLDQDTLIVAWLSDKVAYDLQNERLADKVLKVAEQKVKYIAKNGHK